MIELRTYKISELSAIFHSNSKQSLERKLARYEIEYTVSGRGNDVSYEITAILNKFKVFCITELGMPAQCDFQKFLHFLYYFLNVDDFRWLPDETLSLKMGENGKYASRQTIAHWKHRLETLNIITPSADFTYYFAQDYTQILTDSTTYKKAWREYFEAREMGADWSFAISQMKRTYGGVGRKQPIVEVSAFFTQLYELVNVCFQSEFQSDI